jgi:hypothetical protein
LQAGARHRGVQSVELRPGGAVRYFYAWRLGTSPSGNKQVQQVETACKDGTARQRRVSDVEKQVEPAEEPAETAGTNASMDVDQGGSSKHLGRSHARLVSYGKAMGFLKGLVFKRWMEATRQEKQEKQEQQRAEAAAAAAAASAAAANAARERELAALRRELDGARGALSAVQQRECEAQARLRRLENRRQSRSPSEDDERARRQRPSLSAAAEEQQPPAVARETAAATGRGKGKGYATGAGKGYGYGYGSRGRGYI